MTGTLTVRPLTGALPRVPREPWCGGITARTKVARVICAPKHTRRAPTSMFWGANNLTSFDSLYREKAKNFYHSLFLYPRQWESPKTPRRSQTLAHPKVSSRRRRKSCMSRRTSPPRSRRPSGPRPGREARTLPVTCVRGETSSAVKPTQPSRKSPGGR